MSEVSNNASRLSDTWGNWLRARPWSWYGHLTFARPHGPDAASATFRKFHHRLNRWSLGVHYYKRHKGLRCFMAVEGADATNVHIHFLVADISPELILRARVWWWKKAGNARIEQYDATMAGTFYCSKKVRGSTDGLELLGDWAEDGSSPTTPVR